MQEQEHNFDCDQAGINRRLKDRFGTEFNGKQRFRIVWSDAQQEKRFGVFIDWHGPIFVREVSEVREVPKYQFIKHRWVIEKYFHVHQPEIFDAPNKGYEAIYPFEDRFGRPLQVLEEVVMNICYFAMNGRFENKKTDSDVREAEIKKRKAEINAFEQQIDAGLGSSLLSYGGGISMRGRSRKGTSIVDASGNPMRNR